MSQNSAASFVAFAAFLSLPAIAQRTSRVSVSTLGTPTNGSCQYPAISADGRHVVFMSAATNLVPADTNRRWDIFLHDRFTSETTRVSVSSSGVEADANSHTGYATSISADGRYVVFQSGATNLVPGDTNRTYDAFLRDVKLGQTQRISEGPGGVQAGEGGGGPTISEDGRYVAFSSEADVFVPGDTNEADDIFVRDLSTGQIVRVSVSSAGAEGDGDSYAPSLSADGRYVAFQSEASNLVPGDTNQTYDVYLHDMVTGTTTLVSTGVGGTIANSSSELPSISSDGRKVAFVSLASNLVAGDLNGFGDAFVRDTVTGQTVLASVDSAGQQADAHTYYPPAISGSGRFVAFNTSAYSMVVPDAFGGEDVYVHDLSTGTTTRESTSTGGQQGNDDTYQTSLSADGRFVAFKSKATNLVEGVSVSGDILVRDRGSEQATFFCGSEVVGQTCPCSNAGTIARGCDNSSWTHGAWLTDFGTAQLSNDTLVIVASSVVAQSQGVLVQGTAQAIPRPLGEGVRCLGPGVRRLYSRIATPGGGVAVPGSGDPSISARSASAGDPIAPGTTRFYQLYYFDPDASVCGSDTGGVWNSSNGLAISWVP